MCGYLVYCYESSLCVMQMTFLPQGMWCMGSKVMPFLTCSVINTEFVAETVTSASIDDEDKTYETAL